jgi:beta-phosphoglucomutase family hydrolase
MLGLPNHVTALLFDLDGVLTDTASLHFQAWRDTFDQVLSARGQPGFTEDDYDQYVDGKPREDGVTSFLRSRGIELPPGAADSADSDDSDDSDDTSLSSVQGVANAKNDTLLALIRSNGVEVFPGSRAYLERAEAAGLRRAVVSSSANAGAVLDVTGLARLVEAVVDGNTLAEQHLAGKPAPDSFLAGARLLDVEPADAAVFEDAVAGVAAGHDGRFGCVVGVNRLDDHHGEQLAKNGADLVVSDLGELL